MMTPRVALGAVVLFAMVRFFLTPTWPCAFVVLGALMVAVASETVVAWRRDGHLSALADDVSDLKATVTGLSASTDGLAERVDRVERLRALGG